MKYIEALWPLKYPYVMLSSRIHPCGGEIEPLQKVENRYMEQFGVSEGFNPSEDFESAHDKAWCQAVDAYMFWKSVAEQCGCLTPQRDLFVDLPACLWSWLSTCLRSICTKQECRGYHKWAHPVNSKRRRNTAFEPHFVRALTRRRYCTF